MNVETASTADPLLAAIELGEVGQVERLIALGRDPNLPATASGRRRNIPVQVTPLAWAAALASVLDELTALSIIDVLLRAGADPTLAGVLLHADHEETIALLIAAGANPNQRDPGTGDGTRDATPLLYACERQSQTTIATLATLGADISLVDHRGRGALDYAILGRPGTRITTDADVADRVSTLITLGAIVTDFQLFTKALVTVAQTEILDRTITRVPGPGGNLVDRVIYSRSQVSLRPLFECLEDLGGNPVDAINTTSLRANILMTILMNPGFRFEPFDEINWLLQHNALFLMDQTDINGDAALHYIFRKPVPDFELPSPAMSRLVRLLLAYETEPDRINNDGDTPLHLLVKIACRPKGTVSPYPFPCDGNASGTHRPSCGECLKAAEAIIDAGADPARRNLDGLTAWELARTRPDCPLAKVIPRLSLTSSLTEPQDPGSNGGQMAANKFDPRRPLRYSLPTVKSNDVWALGTDPLFEDKTAPDGFDEHLGVLAHTGEDPEVARMHPEARSLYYDANSRYKSSAGHVEPYIRINPGNARRSTLRQAQLFEAYLFHEFFGGPTPAPRANRPGKSLHEYGFAMDVIRSSDEARLSAALLASGWKSPISDEGWHWEAQDTPSFARLGDFIKTSMELMTKKWAETLSTFYERRKERLSLLVEYEAAAREEARLDAVMGDRE